MISSHRPPGQWSMVTAVVQKGQSPTVNRNRQAPILSPPACPVHALLAPSFTVNLIYNSPITCFLNGIIHWLTSQAGKVLIRPEWWAVASASTDSLPVPVCMCDDSSHWNFIHKKRATRLAAKSYLICLFCFFCRSTLPLICLRDPTVRHSGPRRQPDRLRQKSGRPSGVSPTPGQTLYRTVLDESLRSRQWFEQQVEYRPHRPKQSGHCRRRIF